MFVTFSNCIFLSNKIPDLLLLVISLLETNFFSYEGNPLLICNTGLHLLSKMLHDCVTVINM